MTKINRCPECGANKFMLSTSMLFRGSFIESGKFETDNVKDNSPEELVCNNCYTPIDLSQAPDIEINF